MLNRYQEAMEKIMAKHSSGIHEAAEKNMIPYKSEQGQWVASPFDGNSWWTGGFYPALMWQFRAAGGDGRFLAEALRTEKLLTDEFRIFTYLNHDVGFMYLFSCGANAKITGSLQAKADTLHAASLLMGRFNPTGFIRAWNHPSQAGFAIIDCMMNLSILFRASREIGDPRFSNTARIHADTTLREFLRADGSVSHIVEFDPSTGAKIREHAGQGYALGSQWSRGQAWGLYGFTLAHMNTGEKRYLDAAQRIAANFISHIRPDGLTDCDFCQPAGTERLDNIAGAVAACGLQELNRVTGKKEYLDAALKLIDGMLDHCCDYSDRIRGVLTHCTASYHDDAAGKHTNITYGDYFLVEALAKMNGTDPMLWL